MRDLVDTVRSKQRQTTIPMTHEECIAVHTEPLGHRGPKDSGYQIQQRLPPKSLEGNLPKVKDLQDVVPSKERTILLAKEI